MAIALVQASTVATSTGTGSVGPSWPAPTTAGNLLVAIVVRNTTGVITSPAGWADAGATSATNPPGADCFFIANAGSRSGAESFSVPATTPDMAAILLEYSGMGNAPEVDVSSSSNSGGATGTAVDTLATAATAHAAELFVGGLFNRNDDQARTPTMAGTATGGTLANRGHAVSGNTTANSRICLTAVDYISTGAGTAEFKETLTTARVWSAGVWVFKPQGATVPTGLAQAIALGSPPITATVAIEPNGLAQPVALGGPVLTSIAHISPSGLGQPLALGDPALTSIVGISPDGLAQLLALGGPTLTSIVAISPDGLEQPVALGEPGLAAILVVRPDGLVQPVALGSPGAAVQRFSVPAGLVVGVVLGGPTLRVAPLYLLVARDIDGSNPLEVPLTALEYGGNLEAPGTIAWTSPALHPDVTPGTLTPASRKLELERAGRRVWSGRLLQDDVAASQPNPQFTGEDWLSVLFRRFVEPMDVLDFVAGTDYVDVAWGVIDYTQGKEDIGITRGTPHSIGPNREIDEGDYLEFGWWDGRSLGDILVDLSNTLSKAFYFYLDPDRVWHVYRRTFPHHRGSKYTFTKEHIIDVRRTRDGTNSVSRVIVHGAGSGEDDSIWAVQTNAGARARWGLLEDWLERGNYRNDAMQAQADFWANRRATYGALDMNLTATLRQESFPYGIIKPGDIVMFDYQRGYLKLDADTVWRVGAVKTAWTATGQEVTTLTCNGYFDNGVGDE